MGHNEIEYRATICCGSPFSKAGWTRFTCDRCGKDVTIEVLFLDMSIKKHKKDNEEKVRNRG